VPSLEIPASISLVLVRYTVHTDIMSTCNIKTKYIYIIIRNTITWLSSMSLKNRIARALCFYEGSFFADIRTTVCVVGSGTNLTAKHTIEESRYI